MVLSCKYYLNLNNKSLYDFFQKLFCQSQDWVAIMAFQFILIIVIEPLFGPVHKTQLKRTCLFGYILVLMQVEASELKLFHKQSIQD